MSEDNSKIKDLEILSCSPEFYMAMQERAESAYDLFPVDVSYVISNGEVYGGDTPLENLKQKARELGCQAVTDLRQMDGLYNIRYLVGIGVRLKREQP